MSGNKRSAHHICSMLSLVYCRPRKNQMQQFFERFDPERFIIQNLTKRISISLSMTFHSLDSSCYFTNFEDLIVKTKFHGRTNGFLRFLFLYRIDAATLLHVIGHNLAPINGTRAKARKKPYVCVCVYGVYRDQRFAGGSIKFLESPGGDLLKIFITERCVGTKSDGQERKQRGLGYGGGKKTTMALYCGCWCLQRQI